MTLGQHQEAFARDLVRLLLKAWELGYEVRIGETFRTPEQQAIYIQRGLSKTEGSQHLNKTAADLHFRKGRKLYYPQQLGDYWESLHPLNQWGGNWKTFRDAPHFERHVSTQFSGPLPWSGYAPSSSLLLTQ